MDYFYAQVEERDNPSLKSHPVAIGGPSKTKGVLCTSNYIARKYGVRSAMPTFQAFKKCPNLILVKPNFEKYKAASQEIQQIFSQYTDLVQPLSLDEAFLDVTHSKKCNGSATLIAQEIRSKIYEKTGLTSSAGVSFNKLISKIASDYNKPNGLTVVTPEDRLKFMNELSLRKIPGIGQTAMQRFERLGLNSCNDVLDLGIQRVIELFGNKNGLDLYERCLGISNSPVVNLSKRKAMSVETTFSTSINEKGHVLDIITSLLHELESRIKRASDIHFNNRRVTHIKIKIRTSQFETFTKEIRIDDDMSDLIVHKRSMSDDLKFLAQESLINYYDTMKEQELRLLGIGIKFDDKFERQIELNV